MKKRKKKLGVGGVGQDVNEMFTSTTTHCMLPALSVALTTSW